jgi:hypothetical protein
MRVDRSSMTLELRQKLYKYGVSILAVDALMYVLAGLRTPHIDPTGYEFFLYFFGGGSLCMLALLFLGIGFGRGRTLLVLFGVVGLYFWFSYVTFQVMLH